MQLSELRGEGRVIRQLSQALATDTLPHGLLFIGPEGVGKGAAAQALAARLLCDNPQGIDACGQCPACGYLAKGAHPDLLEPAKDLGPDQTIGIARLRQLLDQLATTSHGRQTVVVIEEADRLTREAANAFLKTLEEPAEDITFILTATHAEALPETVRSRLASYLFTPLPAEDVAAILAAESPDYRPAQVDLAAGFSGGSVARGRRLLQDDGLVKERQDFFRLLDTLPQRHPGLLVEDVQALSQVPGEKRPSRGLVKGRFRRFLAYAESYYLNGLKTLLAIPANTHIPAPDLPSAQAGSQILARLRQGLRQLETGADPGLVFLVTLLAIRQLLAPGKAGKG